MIEYCRRVGIMSWREAREIWAGALLHLMGALGVAGICYGLWLYLGHIPISSLNWVWIGVFLVLCVLLAGLTLSAIRLFVTPLYVWWGHRSFKKREFKNKLEKIESEFEKYFWLQSPRRPKR